MASKSPRCAQGGIWLCLTILSCIAYQCSAFSEENPTDQKVLVLLDDDSIKSSHSLFFKSLQDRGYDLDFKLATDSSLSLQKYGEYLYDAAVIFAPKVESFGGSVDLAAIIDFIDTGHDLILAAAPSVSDIIRDIATECGVDLDETADGLVVDHQDYAITALDGDHTLVIAENLVNSTVLLGPSEFQGPILYRGLGMSVSPSTDLVVPVLTASSLAYTAAPGAILTSVPALQGSSIALVAAMQARNNARVLISGSLELFSDKLFNVQFERPGEGDPKAEYYEPIYHKTGNRELAVELSKWTFHERGHLKAVNLRHHKTGEQDEPAMYRVSDYCDFSVEIHEWTGKEWRPYQADDVQLQFFMMSPYGLYHTSFQVPDVYGVFQFKVEYKRLGYSGLSLSKQIPVRPFRHDEYERFIGSAYPYYASAFSMMAGFFVFGFVFLYHKPIAR
eukprot:jgi/Mesen1/8822/ME000053S08219